MLLRLVGFVVLSTLCGASGHDDSHFYSEQRQQFEEHRVRRDVRYGNFSSAMPGGPGDLSVMFPDTSICDVLLNSPNPVSIDQIPFFCLCSHCKATTGPKGERGDRGLQGFQGSPGKRGYMGYRGRRGFTGPLGLKGQKGDQGGKGQPGPIGFPGPKGEQGLKGEKGDHGVDGPPGPLGPQGWPGSCLCDSFIGAPGIQGPPGPQGAQGLPGTVGSKGTKGASGDKGDMGVDGQDGAAGLQGEQGDPGLCDCADGKNGTDGQKGDKGDTGGKGDLGPKGDQGDTGAPGPMGDPGYPGIPGPCSMPVQSSFCVGLDESFPLMNRPVRFNRIISNIYDHYNTILGIYIAPTNGTYVFDFNFAVNEKILVVGLFVNFFPILKMTEGTNYATTSGRVILHLLARDLVWIQIKDNDSNGMFVDGESSSTFCGFLLSPDSCSYEGFRDVQTTSPDIPDDIPWV